MVFASTKLVYTDVCDLVKETAAPKTKGAHAMKVTRVEERRLDSASRARTVCVSMVVSIQQSQSENCLKRLSMDTPIQAYAP